MGKKDNSPFLTGKIKNMSSISLGDLLLIKVVTTSIELRGQQKDLS